MIRREFIHKKIQLENLISPPLSFLIDTQEEHKKNQLGFVRSCDQSKIMQSCSWLLEVFYG